MLPQFWHNWQLLFARENECRESTAGSMGQDRAGLDLKPIEVFMNLPTRFIESLCINSLWLADLCEQQMCYAPCLAQDKVIPGLHHHWRIHKQSKGKIAKNSNVESLCLVT